MTVFGSSCASCPDPGYVNQTTIAGNAPVIGAGGPPAAGADPSATPQTVINVYDDTIRIFVSNDGVTWSHSDLNSLTCDDLNTCSITNLSDVDTVSTPPVSGQFLKWDGADWIPAAQTDVHFLSDDLSSSANRSHTLNNNYVILYGNTAFNDGSQFFIDGDSVSLGGGTGDFGGNDYTYLNVGSNMEFVFQNNAEMQFGGQAGLSGWVLTSNGANNGPTWQAVPDTNSNITTGTLAAATASRTVDMDGNNLSFDSVNACVLTVQNGFQLYGDQSIFGNGADNGFLQIYDSDDSQYVAFTVPSGMASYTLTMPPAGPSAGQVMAFDASGVGSFVDNPDTNTNMVNTDLSSSAIREHLLNGNSFRILGNTTGANGCALELNTQFAGLQGGSVDSGNSCSINLNTAGMNFVFGGVCDLKLNGSAGTSGQVLTTNGDDLAPSWTTLPVVGNITTGTVDAATGTRTIDFGGNDVSFNNTGNFTVDGGAAIFTGSYTGIRGEGAAAGGLRIYDGDNSNYVGILAITDITGTYNITLPATAPTASGQVLSFQTNGLASFADQTHFLNTDLSSSGSRTHLLNNNFFSIKGNTAASNGAQINVNGSLIYLQGANDVTSGNITLNGTGVNLQMIGATDLRLNSDPGTAGQIIQSNGSGVPATWEDLVPNHTVTYTDDSLNAYDTVADNGSGNGGPSNRPGSPIEGDEVIELYSNGILKEIYDGSQWISTFNSSCCSAATISLTSGTLSPASPEAPTALEIQSYYDALGDSAKGVGTIIVYTSPLSRYYSWTIDIAGNAILQESPAPLGFSDEGTISGIPASVAGVLKKTYIFDVNTLAGNVDLSAMNTITGAPDGAELIFRNTGENNILFDQDINGSTVQYTASGAGSTLRIFYSASGTGNHQAG